jgi:hypothetical protein
LQTALGIRAVKFYLLLQDQFIKLQIAPTEVGVVVEAVATAVADYVGNLSAIRIVN